jgi:hypothetical protein
MPTFGRWVNKGKRNGQGLSLTLPEHCVPENRYALSLVAAPVRHLVAGNVILRSLRVVVLGYLLEPIGIEPRRRVFCPWVAALLVRRACTRRVGAPQTPPAHY